MATVLMALLPLPKPRHFVIDQTNANSYSCITQFGLDGIGFARGIEEPGKTDVCCPDLRDIIAGRG